MKFTGSKTLLLLSLAATLAGFIVIPSPEPYAFPSLQYFPKMPVNADNPVTKEGARLGRFLFYDPILSRDSTFSCSSCHKQEFAFSGGNVDMNKGLYGDKMKRNTQPLFNLAWYKSYFWDGRATSIEAQVFQPVQAHTEMDLDWKEAVARVSANKTYRKMFTDAFGDEKIDSILISKAIAQFERTLISSNSKYDKVIFGKAKYTADELDGYIIMNDQSKGDCLHCHTTDGDPIGTTGDFSNNGLDKAMTAQEFLDQGLGGITGNAKDIGKFQIPSLRNIAFTAPYMHDGRFKTLEEVLSFYSSGVNVCMNVDPMMEYAYRRGAPLTVDQQKHIIAFLKALSDSTFVSDTAFSSPFH